MQKAMIDVSGIAQAGGRARPPEGPAAEPAALAEVRALLGDAPRRRDLLIEFLHRIQDATDRSRRRISSRWRRKCSSR